MKKVNILEGSLWRQLLQFAVPLALTGILQQLFNASDVAVVGRFVGKDAMAAVGSAAPIVNIMVNVFVGLSVGANVVISQYLGKKSLRETHAAVHTALIISFFSGILIWILGWILMEPMLRFIETPEQIFPQAKVYLKWYFVGMPFMMLYNFESAIFRSVGDTKTPLIALVISGVLNVLLNVLFIVVFKMGVAGVAVATLLAGVVSAAILFVGLRRSHQSIHLEYRRLKMDAGIFWKILKIGVPAGLQGVVFSFSNLCIQGGINSLGSDAKAGSAAGFNIEIMVYFVVNAFGQAAVTFVGQNFGARNLKRCTQVVVQCMLLDLIFTNSLGVLLLAFGENILGLFSTNKAVIEYGFVRMIMVIGFESLNVFIEVLSGAVRGFGKSFMPAFICVVGICGVRLLWLYTVFESNSDFLTLMTVYPVSWASAAFALVFCYYITKRSVFRLPKKRTVKGVLV